MGGLMDRCSSKMHGVVGKNTCNIDVPEYMGRDQHSQLLQLANSKLGHSCSISCSTLLSLFHFSLPCTELFQFGEEEKIIIRSFPPFTIRTYVHYNNAVAPAIVIFLLHMMYRWFRDKQKFPTPIQVVIRSNLGWGVSQSVSTSQPLILRLLLLFVVATRFVLSSSFDISFPGLL